VTGAGELRVPFLLAPDVADSVYTARINGVAWLSLETLCCKTQRDEIGRTPPGWRSPVTARRNVEGIRAEGSVAGLSAWGDPGHSSAKCLPLSAYTSVDPGHTGKPGSRNLPVLVLRLLDADRGYKNPCQC